MRLNAETPLRDVSVSGATRFELWAWVELNYRPHAYQAGSYEHELGSKVLLRPTFTNILLSKSRLKNVLRAVREHFAHSNGHRNGHNPRTASKCVGSLPRLRGVGRSALGRLTRCYGVKSTSTQSSLRVRSRAATVRFPRSVSGMFGCTRRKSSSGYAFSRAERLLTPLTAA